MPGDKKPTNRVLILIAVALCLFFGATLTQSSAEPSSRRQEMPDMFVADDNGTFPFASNVSQGQETSRDPSSVNTEETVSPTPAPTATPVPTITPIYQVSPEASRGVWTSSGSSWLFMVDGVPYTGWLTDTDGNRYYFNEDGYVVQSDQDFAIQIPADVLRRCPNIIGVCSANTSPKAVRGALKSGFFTQIVARSEVIETLLEQ